MSKINVKIATSKVIESLENRLESDHKIIVDNEKAKKEYDKAYKEWAREVAELVIKQVSKAEFSANENYRGEVNVSISVPAGVIKLPEQPRLERKSELGNWQKEEVENAIRLLKMTDDEFVNASTMKSISQYL